MQGSIINASFVFTGVCTCTLITTFVKRVLLLS